MPCEIKSVEEVLEDSSARRGDNSRCTDGAGEMVSISMVAMSGEVSAARVAELMGSLAPVMRFSLVSSSRWEIQLTESMWVVSLSSTGVGSSELSPAKAGAIKKSEHRAPRFDREILLNNVMLVIVCAKNERME